MKPGQLFRLRLPDGRYAAGKIIAVEDRVIGVALAAAVWDCAPEKLDVQETPRLLDHVPMRPARLDDVEWIGEEDVEEQELSNNYRLWSNTPVPRTVVDAPVAALLKALQ